MAATVQRPVDRGVPRDHTPGVRATRWRIAGWLLALLALANAAIVVALCGGRRGRGDRDGTAGVLAEVARLSGLLGAYLALVELLLLARLPVLDRLAGFDRLTVWHRWNGSACARAAARPRRPDHRRATRSRTGSRCRAEARRG